MRCLIEWGQQLISNWFFSRHFILFPYFATLLCLCFSLTKVMTFSDVNPLFFLSSSLASSLSLVIFAKLTFRLFCPLSDVKNEKSPIESLCILYKMLSTVTVEVKIILKFSSTYSQRSLSQGQSLLYLRNAETVDVITQTFNFVTTSLRLRWLKCHFEASFWVQNG